VLDVRRPKRQQGRGDDRGSSSSLIASLRLCGAGPRGAAAAVAAAQGGSAESEGGGAASGGPKPTDLVLLSQRPPWEGLGVAGSHSCLALLIGSGGGGPGGEQAQPEAGGGQVLELRARVDLLWGPDAQAQPMKAADNEQLLLGPAQGGASKWYLTVLAPLATPLRAWAALQAIAAEGSKINRSPVLHALMASRLPSAAAAQAAPCERGAAAIPWEDGAPADAFDTWPQRPAAPAAGTAATVRQGQWLQATAAYCQRLLLNESQMAAVMATAASVAPRSVGVCDNGRGGVGGADGSCRGNGAAGGGIQLIQGPPGARTHFGTGAGACICATGVRGTCSQTPAAPHQARLATSGRRKTRAV
jgi:hypothetical protein